MKFLGKTMVIACFQEDFPPGIEPDHFLRRFIAQHVYESGVHIEESAIQSRTIDPVDGTLHQRSIACLGLPQRLLMALMVDRAGELLRNESKNFFVAFSEAHIFAITLHDQHAKSLSSRAQRNSHPVQRSGAD